MTTQTIDINLIPSGINPVVHVSQYDTGARTLVFNLVSSEPFDLTGISAAIEGEKPDGNFFSYSCTVDGNVVTANCDIQMTVLAGNIPCVLRLSNAEGVLRTLNFVLAVEEKPMADDSVISETDIPAIVELAQDQVYDAEAWAVGTRDGVPVESTDPAYENNSKYWSEHSGDDAEAWAAGTRGGEPVPSTDPAYHNNSKYYSEQAEEIAEDAGEDAEAWAVGTRGGEPVESTDPAYHNNAKYWSEQTEFPAASQIKLGTDEWGDIPDFDDWTNYLLSGRLNKATDITVESGTSPIDGVVELGIPTGWMYYNYAINNPNVIAQMIGKTIEFGANTYNATFEATNMVSLAMRVNGNTEYIHLTPQDLGQGSENLPYNTHGVAIAVTVPEGCDLIEMNYVSCTHYPTSVAGDLELGYVYAFDINELELPDTHNTRMTVNRFLQDQSSYDNNSLNLLKNGKIIVVNNVGERVQLGGQGGSVSAETVDYDNTDSGLTADNVQDAIDDLAENSSGSFFHIHTAHASLIGEDVTATGSTQIKTATFDNLGNATIRGFADVGTISFSATDGEQTVTASLNVPYFGTYSLNMASWAATVNIHTTNPSLYNKIITITKGGTTVGTTPFNSSGEATFTATEAGTYTFTCEGSSATLNVTEETTYNVYISAGLDLQGWLTAGGVTGTYADFAAVEADEKAVRKLMTIHDAVDYLAQSDGTDELIGQVINSDICAKWINLRDYALDTLSANADIKEVMDTADKYGYGEWVLEGQVPTMTSDTTPYGEAFSSTPYGSSYYAWQAFSGTVASTTDCWAGKLNETVYLGYDFTTPVKITKLMMQGRVSRTDIIRTFKVQGSNTSKTDGYVDITSNLTNTNTGGGEKNYHEFSNTNSYRYYRIVAEIGGENNVVGNLQFYAYQPKGNVPIMTSNTAPYGEAIGDSTANYTMFDNSLSTCPTWGSSAQGGSTTLGYKFTNPVCVKKMKFTHATTLGTSVTGKIQGSNDGTNWTDLTSEFTLTGLSSAISIFDMDLDNDDYYLQYRIYFTSAVRSSTSSYYALYTLQFYGREMKVSVPTMTSNTAPWGEAFATNNLSYAFWAFNERPIARSDNGWYPPSDGENSIGYDFKIPVSVKRLRMEFGDLSVSRDYSLTLQGSNDGTNYTDIDTISVSQATSNMVIHRDFNNSSAYRYYRLTSTFYFNASWGYKINFFGFDYSEYDWDTNAPRHYLYDHGVEVEAIEVVDGGGISEKRPSSLFLKNTASNSSSLFVTSNAIDLTDYSMERNVVDRECKLSSSGGFANHGVTGAKSTSYVVTTYKAWGANTTELPDNNVVDISAISQSMYPYLSAGMTALDYVEVKEWWLE